MPNRGSNGRFLPNEKEEENFISEFKSFFNILYRFWRYVPLCLLLFIIWKYFDFTKKIQGLIIEIICGTGCSCNCFTKKNDGGI